MTRKWRVVGGADLGWVVWFSHWRRYVFQPHRAWSSPVFDASCLREIADFCEGQTLKHREARKRLKERKGQ